MYTISPFNFFLNPVPDERLNVERVFSYQSGAVQFLLQHKFRMEAPFLEGVPYFSRDEEAAARAIAIARQDKTSVPDLTIKKDDTEALEFVRRVRQEIAVWKSRTGPQPDFLNIAPVGHSSHSLGGQGLNNYQKRLVHQLVRAEHPDLVTISRPGFIQIVAFNQEREDLIKKDRNKYFEEKLSKQTGLRWIIEAMVRGDLSPIDPKTLETTVEGRSEEVISAFNELRGQLKAKRTVLVGHNVFLDLINFYKCFFGKLPDRVEDFQRTMHKLFPVIIDTKYLATHNVVNPALSRSALEDLDNELSKLPVPVIETHPDHDKYANTTPAHEAGFDSFLTAKVLIRLSAKLEAAGHYVDENGIPQREDEEYETTPEDGGVILDKLDADPAHNSDASDSSNQGVSLVVAALDAATISQAETEPKRPKAPKSNRSKASPPTGFSHQNSFDLLDDMATDEDALPMSLRPENSVDEKKGRKEKKREKKRKKFTMMPPFESHFWTVYGNKLRVNGTVEEVCYMKS